MTSSEHLMFRALAEKKSENISKKVKNKGNKNFAEGSQDLS